MPTDGYDTPTQMVLDNLFGHTGERYTVKILLVVHLDTAEFKAHHGRPVAADIQDITAICLVFPGETIERIILMTEHITLLA